MRYRKLDAGNDMVFGHGGADFYRDQPEAVAQATVTRLRLKLGEWFADTSDGTNWDGAILGRHTEGRRDAEIRGRIAATQGVTGLVTYMTNLDPGTRNYTVQATIDTQYGAAKVVTPL